MRVKIEIDTNTFIRFLLVVSGFVGVVFLLWQLMPVLLILVVSFFLALALNKPVTALARALPGEDGRILATSISYIIFVSVIGAFLVLIVPPIIVQTNIFLDAIPGYIQQASDQKGVVGEVVSRYQLEDESRQFIAGVQGQAGQIAQGLGSNVVAGLSTVVSGFVTATTVLVLTFLMLIEGPMWMQRLWDSYANPVLLERHKRLVSRMYRVVTGYVNGQVLVASIAGVASAATLLILSTFLTVPLSAVLPLAVAIFLTSLIPMIGPIIGASIVAVALLFNDFNAALIFVIYYIIYQQIENNIIQPTVQSRSVELSALGVLVAAIIGVVSLGLLGGILAIPIAGCLRVLLLDFHEERRAARARHSKRLARAKA